MKKFSRNSVLLASTIAGMLCSTANASVDLDAASGAISFSKEINIESDGKVNPSAINVATGFGFNSGNFYVRFDLDNGAKFGTALTGTNLTLSGVNATVSVGGAATDTYVVFNVTVSSAINATSQFTLTLPSIATANRNPVNLRYRLFTDAGTAANPGTSSVPLKDKSATVVKFDTALSLTSITSGSSTASVVDNFLKFLTAPTAVTNVGSFKLSNSNAVAASGGTTISDLSTVADFSAGKSSVVVSGDFSAAFDSGSTSSSTTALARIWLTSASNSCTTSGASTSLLPTAIAVDGKSATFGNLVATSATGFTATSGSAATFSNGVNLCYMPNGSVPIAVSDYSVKFKPVAASNGYVTSSDVTGPVIGSIKRNGAELQAPFANIITGYKSRVYLTNTGSQDAPFTIAVQTEPGTVFTPSSSLPAGFTLSNGLIAGTIPKGGNIFMIVDTLGSFTAASGSTAAPSTRGALIFKIAADCNNIQGMFQLRNTVSGDFDSAPLLRPAGYCN